MDGSGVIRKLTIFMIAVFLPVLAGVEPSPFKGVLNKLNALENHLEGIDERMEQALSKSLDEDNKQDYDNAGGLEAVAEQMCDVQEDLDALMDELGGEDERNPELMHALLDVAQRTTSIIDCVDLMYMNPENIGISLERVKANSEILMYAVRPVARRRERELPDAPAEVRSMNAFVIGDRDIEVDEDGFIVNPDEWDEEVAAALAADEGIDELTEDHWKVVQYLREYYQEYEVAPMIRKLCKATGFKLKKIYELFPSGPAKGACKVAGLPKPTGCV